MSRGEDGAMEEDRHLEERFARLRAETSTSGRTPDFQTMIAEARRRAEAEPVLRVVPGEGEVSRAPGQRASRLRRLAWAGSLGSAALAAGLAAVLLIRGAGSDSEADFERLVASYAAETATGVWRSPTSNLLEVPGLDLMRSMPSIGGSIRGLPPGSAPGAPRPEPEERI